MESIQDSVKRKDCVSFQDIKKRVHLFVDHTFLEDSSLPEEKNKEQNRRAVRGNFGFDIFSVNYVDRYNIERKFMVVNSASEVDSYSFWRLIWESDCRVMVRFDMSDSEKLHWLNKVQSDEYAVGEFIIWKKTTNYKYFTKLELTVRNLIERQSRKLTHYQYHGYPGRDAPDGSTQLISFLKMVNKKQDSYCLTKSNGRKNTSCPVVIHSIGCLERATSICALDVCLDQLMRAKSVLVPNAVLRIRSQVSFENISLEENTSINQTLMHSTNALGFEEALPQNDHHESVSFRSRVMKQCLALNEQLFSKCLVLGLGLSLLVFDEAFRGLYICKKASE